MSGARLVLNFHGIGEPWDGVPPDEVPYWCALDDWLHLADAIAELDRSGPVPVEVTFDDGNLSDVEHALPALLERGLRATFFVCAGRIGEPRYLDDDGLRHLREHGMAVGSHGWAHVDLRRVDDDGLQREAVGSQERLGGVDEFAIPFGSYDRRVLKALRGHRRLYSSDRGLARDGARPVPRESYVLGWEPTTPHRLATRRASAARRLRARAVRLTKRLR